MVLLAPLRGCAAEVQFAMMTLMPLLNTSGILVRTILFSWVIEVATNIPSLQEMQSTVN